MSKHKADPLQSESKRRKGSDPTKPKQRKHVNGVPIDRYWKPMPHPYSCFEYTLEGRLRWRDGSLIAPNEGVVTVESDYERVELEIVKLIAYAHYGPQPHGTELVHLDGDRTNWSLANLRYQTITDVYLMPENGGEALVFPSLGHAAFHLDIPTFDLSFDVSKTHQGDQNWEVALGQLPMPAVAPDRKWITSEHYPGYEFTKDAHVRAVGSKRKVPSVVLHDYEQVWVDRSYPQTHHVIGTVFLDPRPSERHQLDHLDEHKLHNCQSNLEWALNNIERALGMQIARRRSDGPWECFRSYKSAADNVARKRPKEWASFDEATKQTVRATVIRRIQNVLDIPNALAFGCEWRSLVRGPDYLYTCPDCKLEFNRRGDWTLPEDSQVNAKILVI